ncbi:juvenile hormone acid O-methyltransferase-like [Schistocerca piceifrons]|uniref:juvenile hormone acid O-methyltransferase-like n=1 Tax=Schistocerca piceifrons TaxID=274613 RepID=UPI001F5F4945|nr:juvenile hormone acid O-methyltransferase-like [Schistocerca piceifrons]
MTDAEQYVSASAGQCQFAAQVLDQLCSSLDWSHRLERPESSSLPVLDVGCGPGDTTVLELLPRLPFGVRVVAADSSPDMLRKAASRFPESTVDFQLLDIGTPHLREFEVWRLGPYSKVFSFFCLHWVPDQRTALSNICDLLAPGGDAVLVMVGRCPIFDAYEQFSKMPQWAEYMQDYKNFVSPYHLQLDRVQHLRSLLVESGLTVKTCREENDFAFSSPHQHDIIDSLKAVIPFTVRIPAAVRETYLQEIVSACYANGTLSVERGVGTGGADLHRWNFSVLVAHAVKTDEQRHQSA